MRALQHSSSQQTAIRAFEDFLKSPEQVYLLKGAAGTGKTTIIKDFLKILDKNNRNCYLMAPTGRAAYIIGSKTGKEAKTIHRQIYGLKEIKSNNHSVDDEDDGNIHANFTLKDSRLDGANAVYIVDEASMVSDVISENEAFSFGSGKLMSDLFQYVAGRKIVFVGDYAQLPPIGMNFSPALDKKYIEETFNCHSVEVVLTEILRQSSESTILTNATQIRDNIERKTFIEFKLDKGDDCVPEDSDLLQPYFALSAEKPPINAAIVTFTNQQVAKYNEMIRRHYFGENAQRVVSEELLMIARNNYTYDVELFNGNIVKVVATQPDKDVESRLVNVKLGNGNYKQVNLRFRNVSIRFKTASETKEMNVKILDNFLEDPSENATGLISRALIVDFENRLPPEMKKNKRDVNAVLRGKASSDNKIIMLAKEYLSKLREDPYYNAVICKYGYAMTCHKAQGGEWSNVFVDLFRYGGNANEAYFRWSYTALTRASQKLWYYRSPEFTYISNLVVEDIQPSQNIKVSTYSPDTNFCQSRFNRLEELCGNHNFNISEDRTKSYQHIITISDDLSNSATYQLYYHSKGYSNKDTLIKSSSEEFANITKGLIEQSLVPSSVPFESPERPFALKLVEYIKAILSELNIDLLDISQEQFKDIFHLKTDGWAKVSFCYQGSGRYSHMSLQSSLGANDTKLEEFRKRFI